MPPLSSGGSNDVWPNGSFGNSDGNSNDGDSNDGNSDYGGCWGAALTQLMRNDAVGSGDNNLWFSIATGRRDDNKGLDALLLTNATIPQNEDDKYGSGD